MNVGDGFTRVAVEASRSKFKHRVVIRNGGGGGDSLYVETGCGNFVPQRLIQIILIHVFSVALRETQ